MIACALGAMCVAMPALGEDLIERAEARHLSPHVGSARKMLMDPPHPTNADGPPSKLPGSPEILERVVRDVYASAGGDPRPLLDQLESRRVGLLTPRSELFGEDDAFQPRGQTKRTYLRSLTVERPVRERRKFVPVPQALDRLIGVRQQCDARVVASIALDELDDEILSLLLVHSVGREYLVEDRPPPAGTECDPAAVRE